MMAIFWIVFFVVLGLCVIDSWRRSHAARKLQLEAYQRMMARREQNLAMYRPRKL